MQITKTAVDRLTSGVIWDDTVKGFGCRSEGKGKFYILKYRTGKRQRWQTIGRHGSPWTPEQARTKAKQLLGVVASGGDPAATRALDKATSTVKEIRDQYLAHIKARRKPATYNTYRYVLEAFIPSLLKHRATDVTGADIVRLHDAMNHHPYQANLAVRVLIGMYNWGAKRGLVPKDFNPCKDAVEWYPEKARARYLSIEEFQRLGQAMDAAQAEFPYGVRAIALLVLTGARKNEILKLKWEYLDTANGVLNLPDSKTGSKQIYLNSAALALLNAVPRVEGNPYVIVGSRDGGHLAKLDRPWAHIRKAAGLQGVRIHDLRHSFASTAVSGGMSLPMIGQLLGHKNFRTTQRYAHLQHSPMLQASDAVGTAIAAIMPLKNIFSEAA